MNKNHHSPFMKFLGRGIVIRTGAEQDIFFKLKGIAWREDGSAVLLGQDHEGMSKKIEEKEVIKTWSQA